MQCQGTPHTNTTLNYSRLSLNVLMVVDLYFYCILIVAMRTQDTADVFLFCGCGENISTRICAICTLIGYAIMQ